MEHTKWIWFNGEFVRWEDATVHVLTYALHMGSSLFEGIRCYSTPDGPALFRCSAHLRRLSDSAKIYGVELPYDTTTIAGACKAIISKNGLTSAYLRPIAWLGVGGLGTNPLDHPVGVAVIAVKWGAYLGDDAASSGVDVGVSSWRRAAPDTIPTMAKAAGGYLSSQLIALEAHRHGYSEGVALDSFGYVSEGSAENIFVVRNGTLFTPPISAAVLPGITRECIIALARDTGYDVREEPICREMLYIADELFFTGTAAEITPIRSVDRVLVGGGGRGKITAELQRRFFGLFSGDTKDSHGWLEYTEA